MHVRFGTRKIAKLVASLVVVVIVLIVVAFGTLLALRQADIFYVSSRLNTRLWNWSDVEESFNRRFPKGMPREQVIDRLLELDPDIGPQFYNFRESQCANGDGCCEALMPFEGRRLGWGFGHLFCYDDELRLTYVTVAS